MNSTYASRPRWRSPMLAVVPLTAAIVVLLSGLLEFSGRPEGRSEASSQGPGIATSFGTVTVENVSLEPRLRGRTDLMVEHPSLGGVVAHISLRLQNASEQEVLFSPSQTPLEVGSELRRARIAGSSVIAASIAPGSDLIARIDYIIPDDESSLRLSYVEEDGTVAGSVDLSV